MPPARACSRCWTARANLARAALAAATRARRLVEFRNAGFSYPGAAEPVLQDIDLSVGSGQTLAIVGKSGGGKSTLVGLVPRLYDVTSGAVLLDGVDVREYDLRDLRRQVAYVGQDVMLFNDSHPQQHRLWNGRRRRCGHRGGSPGGPCNGIRRGTCRRASTRWWAIAATCSPADSASALPSRAPSCKNAPILILDEATSALDSESERHVQAALALLVQGRTTLVIAHRLSTVEAGGPHHRARTAGASWKSGTHAQLLARDGLYAQLHRLQFDA